MQDLSIDIERVSIESQTNIFEIIILFQWQKDEILDTVLSLMRLSKTCCSFHSLKIVPWRHEISAESVWAVFRGVIVMDNSAAITLEEAVCILSTFWLAVKICPIASVFNTTDTAAAASRVWVAPIKITKALRLLFSGGPASQSFGAVVEVHAIITEFAFSEGACGKEQCC